MDRPPLLMRRPQVTVFPVMISIDRDTMRGTANLLVCEEHDG